LADYPNLANEYETGQLSRPDKTRDLQKRFCFDVFHGAGLTKYCCDNLYSYLDDTHIYTALKSICPKLQKRY